MSLLFYIIIGVFIILWATRTWGGWPRSRRFNTTRRQRGLLGASRYPQLEQQITKRCNWDTLSKERLIRATRARYPDKDEKWVLEKVLFDLERDFR